jgi:hypothetical protein
MKIILLCFCILAAGFKIGASVIAIHEHELKPFTNNVLYEEEVALALKKMRINGLLYAYHLKGFKGERADRYAVVWIFENPQIIEENFGTRDEPKWPEDWLFYENQILAKYLTCHPDKITFTDYCVIHTSNYEETVPRNS